jgi:undecaprenyl diphosphate synthase
LSHSDPQSPISNPAVPSHLGIILDGNRRWAKENGKRASTGHRRGADVLKSLSLELFDRGVDVVSAFVFSTENWKRKASEVDFLMRLFIKLVDSFLSDFKSRNVKIRIIGSRENLNPKVLEAIDRAEKQTANNTGGTLALCFNYGGQEEIVAATKKLITNGVNPDNIDAKTFSDNTYSSDLPDIDLLVRTSGERRLSGFMLWRSPYAELSFVDKNWPDMTMADFDEIFVDYSNRQRRFGC